MSAAPGFEVLTRTNSPAPAARAAVDERLEAVRAEVRADGERVGLEPAGREERLGVALGADVDVAALGVGEHQQAGGAGMLDGLPASACQPAAPRRSKHATCGLTADAGRPGGVDDRAAVGGDVAARARPEPRRVGIEPQDDLGLALARRAPPAGRRRASRQRAGRVGRCGIAAVSR